MDISTIQGVLKGLGYDVGEIDGVMGRKTTAAVKAFQQDAGLKPDGIVGKLTIESLTHANQKGAAPEPAEDAAPAAVSSPTPPWLAEAVSLKGTREVAGFGSNQTILDWADNLDLHYTGDDTPWCGLFVAHCIGSTLPKEKLPGNPLGARQWLQAGTACKPGVGAVLVFWRGSPSGWSGHVGFYFGEDDGAYHVLGGNQSDSVNVARVAKSRLLGARWPDTANVPPGPARRLNGDGSLSADEV